jgi:TetR/AcrR family transcriptional regulator, transcriptional repressor for nem operon
MLEPKVTGRPREFDASEALARILDVFWAKGFEGSSMSDLETATGLRKGSLYAAFGDKRAMYWKALELYDRTAIDGSVRLLTGVDPPERRIGKFLQGAIDAVAVANDRRGCFLCNASVDQAAVDPQTQHVVNAGLGRLGRALENTLAEVGTTDSNRRRATAQHLLTVYFGLRVLAKAGQPVRMLKAGKEAALRSVMPTERPTPPGA